MKGGKSRSKLLISAAKVAGGIAAGQLVNKLTKDLVKENPEYISAGIQIVGGIILGSLGNNTQELALGMAASGMADIVKKAIPSMNGIRGVGMLPYSGAGSTTIPGVAGSYGYGPSGGIMVVE